MIENREQRKKSSLLRRWRIIIIVSVLLALVAGIALYFVYDLANNTITYVDPADGTSYTIKLDNGIWKMYDKKGNLLPTEEAFGYYVTSSGTFVDLKEDSGTYYTRAIPDTSEGELTEYEKVLIFKHIKQSDIRSIEVHNQVDDYTFYRYNIETMKPDDKSDFVLRGSPLLTVKGDIIAALAVGAGYPLANMRVEDPIKASDGALDLHEYGLAPEKRTRTEKNENGEDVTVEYDYKPSYYIITSTKGEQFKMLIGDRIINGGGYYAQYVEITANGEKPRNKIYVLGSELLENALLAEAKVLITPGIAYPVTSNDYYNVTDFTINHKVDGKMQNVVAFSFDSSNRANTVRSSMPYIFTDGRSDAYQPNYDKIDKCLLAFMQPTIIDIAVLSPTQAERAEYGLMSPVLDADGNHVLNENGTKKYVYDSAYVVSFKRTAKDNDGNTVNFLQTVYVSEPNESGNYYSYTVLEFLDDTSMSNVSGITFDMICEVSGDTFNFLKYDEFDWIYPFVLESAIKYTTNITIEKPDYSASFDIITSQKDKYTGTSIAAKKNGEAVTTTFGMLNFTDTQGNSWYIGQNEMEVYDSKGNKVVPVNQKTGTNEIGEKIKYLEEPIKDSNGNLIYAKLNEIKIVYANGTTRTYVRYHTMIFKKFFASINSLAIIDDYYLSAEDEAALVADQSKHLAKISITNTEGSTLSVDFYSITARKAYIIVNGEGGFYVPISSVQQIFDNAEKFFNCENIN